MRILLANGVTNQFHLIETNDLSQAINLLFRWMNTRFEAEAPQVYHWCYRDVERTIGLFRYLLSEGEHLVKHLIHLDGFVLIDQRNDR